MNARKSGPRDLGHDRPIPTRRTDRDQSSCVWCSGPLGAEEGGTLKQVPTACDACAEFLTVSRRQPLTDFIDNLPHPVLVVTGDVVVECANGGARALLGKTAEQIEGRRGGEVIECVNSLLPEGCGRTIHCTGCELRRAISHTHATGERLTDLLTYQDLQTAAGIRKTCFLISTERVGDLVLVRIDGVGTERRA